MNGKKAISIVLYGLCFFVALVLPWWLALPVLIVPLFFNGHYVLGIGFGVLLDAIYGYQLASFPFHTFRYVIAVIIGAIAVFLLKKVIRL